MERSPMSKIKNRYKKKKIIIKGIKLSNHLIIYNKIETFRSIITRYKLRGIIKRILQSLKNTQKSIHCWNSFILFNESSLISRGIFTFHRTTKVHKNSKDYKWGKYLFIVNSWNDPFISYNPSLFPTVDVSPARCCLPNNHVKRVILITLDLRSNMCPLFRDLFVRGQLIGFYLHESLDMEKKGQGYKGS